MVYRELLLKDIDSNLAFSNAKLRIYISERNEAISYRPGLLVLPGGGYGICSPRESEPIAFRFLAEGFNCFILEYSTHSKYPAPHLEVARAMKYIREHEFEFDLIPNSLSLVGFSAGGHLAGSYGYLYKEIANENNYETSLIRPRALVLAYPVTLMNEFTHEGTKEIITGNEEALIKKLDIPCHIESDYPPTFVWATKDDEMVPVDNTICLEEALRKQNVKHECIIFDSGRHGGSLVNRSVYLKTDITEKMKDIRDWASSAANFIFDVLDNEN